MDKNQSYKELQQTVIEAASAKRPLRLTAGDSKAFYGQPAQGRSVSVRVRRDIINYQPTELVVTVAAGMSLVDLEQRLAEQQQMLGFEPPHFSVNATVGGAIATGLSGPRRAFSGAVRDFVLGCKMINGHGEILSFGGEVMKNVAGYDVSRLMAGAFGALGILLEVSLRVMPMPKLEQSLAFSVSADQALELMTQWRSLYLPITGLAYDNERLIVRLAGSEAVIDDVLVKLASQGQVHDNGFWRELKEQRLAFFQGEQKLWRIVVPPATPVLALQGQWCYDWAGALRWFKSEQPWEQIAAAVQAVGGHLSLFRGQPPEAPWPVSPLADMHQQVKRAFDPADIFNRQRRIWEL